MRKARLIRESTGLKIIDVSRKTSILPGHLSDFERGEAGLGAEKLSELSELYGVTINDLLEEITDPEPVAAKD